MTLDSFVHHISNLIVSVNFDYNGYSCGVDPLGCSKYNMWYGDNDVTVDSVENVLNAKIFDGKSLIDIWNDLTEFDY